MAPLAMTIYVPKREGAHVCVSAQHTHVCMRRNYGNVQCTHQEEGGHVCVLMCACVCKRERARAGGGERDREPERERQRERECVYAHTHVCM